MLFKKIKPFQIFLKKYKLNHSLLKQELSSEYDTYIKLKEWFKGKKINKKKLLIYYPGCGSDISSLLLVLDAISDSKEIEVVFVDIRDFYDGILNQLHTYAPGVWIVNHVLNEKYSATAYYKDLTIKINYYISDAESFFPPDCKKNIDIYYERAFEIFRSDNSMINYPIFKNIKPLGFLISDYGFNFKTQKKSFKKLKKIPKVFGLYNNFQIWQKVKK
ncbi:MAG: hypothetical protein ACMXYG_06665 [Candidatus Woesearchaeota archaeon]